MIFTEGLYFLRSAGYLVLPQLDPSHRPVMET